MIPTACSFCKILDTHFSKGYCKDASYTANIIEKKIRGQDVQTEILLVLQLNHFEKLESYWMHELRAIFPYGLDDRIVDEFRTDDKHINVAAQFSSLPRKHSGKNHKGGKNHKDGKNHKGVPCQFLKDLNHMLNTSMKDLNLLKDLNLSNFIRISIFSMKQSYLKITHELLNTKLCDCPPDFIFFIYDHQAIDLIESKI